MRSYDSTPRPPRSPRLPSASRLSFSVLLCVADSTIELPDGRGGGLLAPGHRLNIELDLQSLFEVLCSCTVGYSDFNNLMGFTSKKLPYIILNNVYLKSFLKELAISGEFVL